MIDNILEYLSNMFFCRPEKHETWISGLQNVYSISFLQTRMDFLLFEHGYPGIKNISNTISENDLYNAVLCFRKLLSHQRTSLRRNGMSYIVPGSEICIPSLGIDLNENYGRPDEDQNELFDANTQCIFLYIFYWYLNKQVSIIDISRKLAYSYKVVSNAFNKILTLDSAEEIISKGNRRNIILTGTRKDIFTSSLRKLQSPIVKSHIMENLECDKLFMAGETALSKYSMLSPPFNKIYACKSGIMKKAINSQRRMSVHTRISAVLQEWLYDPSKLSSDFVVDPISLALSFKSTQVDERISMCAFQMLYNCFEKDKYGYSFNRFAYDENISYGIQGLYPEDDCIPDVS